MKTVTSIAALEALYGEASPTALEKVVTTLTPLYRQWITVSRFVILSTVGPEGTDASPRGDNGPVVHIENDATLWLPDWRGNNRIDSLRNIVRDGRVSLMFMVPGSDNVVRVNGTAVLADDAAVLAKFEKQQKLPRTVIVVSLQEAYFQCAKALMRSALWDGRNERDHVPSAGEFIGEFRGRGDSAGGAGAGAGAGDGSDSGSEPAFDAETYDKGYAEYARERMW